MKHKNDEQQSSIPAVSRILPDGRIVELIRIGESGETALAVADGSNIVITNELQLDNGERLIPISASNNLIRHHAILLPEAPEAYGDVGALVSEIESYIARYVALSDSFLHLAAHYVLFTWLYDAFEELPYIRVQADFGSGKTRALIVVGSICYRPFFASGASTVSPIFHTLDAFRSTLVLDEADFRFSDQTAEITKILNNGNVRGFPVFRTAITPKHEFNPQAFQVFGPKLVAMRKSFSDEALESRFITERMDGIRVPPHLPINLPAAQREEAQILRNKLLQYRFDNRLNTHIDETLVDPALSARSNQILVPLLSIVPDESVQTAIRQVVAAAERTQRESRSRTVEADLLGIILEIAATSDKPIPLMEICSRFSARFSREYERPINSRYVANVLRSELGISAYKSHSNYVVAVNRERLEALAVRFGTKTSEQTSNEIAP
jgi:hypothetical protein